MSEGFLFISIIGYAIVHSPWLTINVWESVLSIDEYQQQNTNRLWVIPVTSTFLFISICLYLVCLFTTWPQISQTLEHRQTLYILTFWFVSGVGVLDAILAIFIGVIPLRVVGRSRGGQRLSGVLKIATGKYSRLFGAVYLLSILLLGLAVPVMAIK